MGFRKPASKRSSDENVDAGRFMACRPQDAAIGLEQKKPYALQRTCLDDRLHDVKRSKRMEHACRWWSQGQPIHVLTLRGRSQTKMGSLSA